MEEFALGLDVNMVTRKLPMVVDQARLSLWGSRQFVESLDKLLYLHLDGDGVETER